MLVKDDETLVRVANAVMDWYSANGVARERLAATIERVGLASLQASLSAAG